MIKEGSNELLDVRGLKAVVDHHEILRGIDLMVRAGEVHAITTL